MVIFDNPLVQKESDLFFDIGRGKLEKILGVNPLGAGFFCAPLSPPQLEKLEKLEVLQIVPTILPKHQLEVSRSFKMKKLFKPPIHTSILSYYAPPKSVV